MVNILEGKLQFRGEKEKRQTKKSMDRWYKKNWLEMSIKRAGNLTYDRDQYRWHRG